MRETAAVCGSKVRLLILRPPITSDTAPALLVANGLDPKDLDILNVQLQGWLSVKLIVSVSCISWFPRGRFQNGTEARRTATCAFRFYGLRRGLGFPDGDAVVTVFVRGPTHI